MWLSLNPSARSRRSETSCSLCGRLVTLETMELRRLQRLRLSVRGAARESGLSTQPLNVDRSECAATVGLRQAIEPAKRSQDHALHQDSEACGDVALICCSGTGLLSVFESCRPSMARTGSNRYSNFRYGRGRCSAIAPQNVRGTLTDIGPDSRERTLPGNCRTPASTPSAKEQEAAACAKHVA